jgi:hypothetical protein
LKKTNRSVSIAYHEYHLNKKISIDCESLICEILPQIFNGASSSSKIGWLRKISRDFKHKPRTSFSLKWTLLFGLAPRTETNQRSSKRNIKKKKECFLHSSNRWMIPSILSLSCSLAIETITTNVWRNKNKGIHSRQKRKRNNNLSKTLGWG